MVTKEIEKINKTIKEKDKEKPRVIAIDGYMGAGKSYLAKKLYEECGGRCIELDDHWKRNGAGYISNIDKEELKNDIAKEDGVKYVIGVCVLDILIETNIDWYQHIYVKRLGVSGEWYEKKYFDYNKDIEDIFKEDDEELKSDVITGEERIISKEEIEHQRDRKGLFYDVVRYHFEYRPEEVADIVYEWDSTIEGE